MQSIDRAGVRRRWITALLGAVVPSAVLATAAWAGVRPLTSFLLRSGEQPGFSVRGRPMTSTSLRTFLEGESARERTTRTRLMRAAGFRAFAAEALVAAGGGEGFSLVMEFGSVAGARSIAADLSHWAASGQSGRLTRFSVTGVPGSSGLRAVARGFSTTNVYWAEGRCAFGAGDLRPKFDASVWTPVIAGARALHRRTRGICPG